MPAISVLLSSDVPLPPFIKGKVRDTYDLGEYLLIVATDRISAFDVVLPVGIADKGRVLNLLSAFWFDKTKHIVPNHVKEVVGDPKAIGQYVAGLKAPLPAYLAGRSMVVKKAGRIAVECVVRGYLSGSGWSEYQQSGTVCGVKLPAGMKESQKLGEPIFTPTTKAEAGHDQPITMVQTESLVGKDLARQLRDTSVAVYRFAFEYALSRGLIIADTKMEFGLYEGGLILIDELLTPDSSRSGRPAATRSASLNQATTSSRCGTGWWRPAGTRSLPPPGCHRMLQRLQASATARPTRD